MIQKLTQNDKATFLKLAEAFYSSEAVLHPVPAENHLHAFEELMRSDVYMECFLFSHNGAPAGYALISKMYSHEAGGLVIWLEELFVLPEYRSFGLGRKFLAYLEKQMPAARYRLEIEPDNQRAENLYLNTGFARLPYVQMVKETENR